MKGYQKDFLGNDYSVGIPNYDYYGNDIAINNQNNTHILDYMYYSVLQSWSRRVPILSASNIYRTEFRQADREGDFKEDKRIGSTEQLNSEDYSLFNKIKPRTIAKGHMTKREDVQWDEKGIISNAIQAAKSTFYYPNACPQHHDGLNNSVWKNLENSIIIKGHVRTPQKVCVFTGPVLDMEDPEYNALLHDGSKFKIPILFWKIVYYVKEEEDALYYAGFLMGQVNLLRKDNLITEVAEMDIDFKKVQKSLKPFLEFEADEKYQVPISLIEDLTELKFDKAIDRHKNESPSKLSFVQVMGLDEFGNDEFSFVEGLNV